MRIVIDLQAVQSTGSRDRGIGRYSLALALAIARNRREHEVMIALNGLFPDTIEPIRGAFDGILPQENIRVWSALSPVASADAVNDWRRQSAELVREAFLASLRPDVVHVSSLFEGLGDDAVTSVGALPQTIPTAVTLYDLIPYIHRERYLESPVVEAWYLGKIEHLRRADLWLAISESTRREGIDHLGLPEDRSVNIATDADPHFKPIKISRQSEKALREKYALHQPFVMYTGGVDYRKNLEGLIRAFAKLPTALRKTYQLTIICSVQPESRYALEQVATHQGLGKNEVVLTGFVPEQDLVALYNLCTLFVFPSWHEGFGLPALEAMRCGAPVIGANTSSLPEVIGWDEALFDPRSDEAMARAMERALTDVHYRAELERLGEAQSAKFSWDESARRAIAAMGRLVSERLASPETRQVGGRRPRLAYVSPLPPEKSGIADYSAELLPELVRHYEIEVIIAPDTISHPWIEANCPIRSVQWFVENADQYDRVLYHFGNSTYHQHMFELLRAIPGVVVLHDFFLSGIISHMDIHGYCPGYWEQELYRSHGYAAVRDRHVNDAADIIWSYPCSLRVIQDSLGVIAHSPNSFRMAEKWYGSETKDWALIPLLRDPPISADKALARNALGFGSNDFLVCTFGIIGPHKLNQRVVEGWLKSCLAKDKSCHLVFVGENHPGDYGRGLLATIRRSGVAENIRITGWADRDVFRQYLAAADVGVQMRTLSRGETSAAVLDCMNYGLATIVNANGSMVDLDGKAVWKLPDEFSDEQLTHALETLWMDPARRRGLGEAAREIIVRKHNPRTCAERYCESIEFFYRTEATDLHRLPAAIANINGQPGEDADLISLADSMGRSILPRVRQRQLLVDISELAQRDAQTGIQRVVRNILKEWLNVRPNGYRVEPVFATIDQGYRYARRYTLDFLDCPDSSLLDEPVEYAPGDVFLGLDLQPEVVVARREFYRDLRRRGVVLKFVIYDLLCVLTPQYFTEGLADAFGRWLDVVTESDGALCISKAVSDELCEWIGKRGLTHERPFAIHWFHLGADIASTVTSEELPADAATLVGKMRARPVFLMVGTLEPRKGHVQVLDAFEQLWNSGIDINLVIVGKQGWMVEGLIKRLRVHPEFNERLFWLERISDEYLIQLYAVSACLIAASYGEGFGLPLIEAAQHKLPIIARDIPVFREVAGAHAYYFPDDTSPDVLEKAVREWLALYEKDSHVRSDELPWVTWEESAQQLLDVVLGRNTESDTLAEASVQRSA